MTHLLLAIIYISFISLGLPDALLGAAWPSMYGELGASLSQAGIIFMIISAGTVVSSLASDWMTKKLGTGKVTAFSVGMTAIALFGFSTSTTFLRLCLWAVPYGLGAGSVDASLNNYVALHYASRHMSWLHCMWGVGASVGPYIMGYYLTNEQGWNSGYRSISILQVILVAILFISLPLWKGKYNSKSEESEKNSIPINKIITIPGVKEVMITFFCYCAVEQTTGLWASSYLALNKGVDNETAAFFASIFFLGITVGRAANGFLTLKFNDTQLIRLGLAIILAGILTMLLPLGKVAALSGFILIGLGCAPIYPCIIHSTPENFGANRSQAVIGVQMASAYMGNICMPPLFGMIAENINIAFFPIYLLVLTGTMYLMHKRMLVKVK